MDESAPGVAPLTTAAIRTRVDDLLAAMTPEEKAGQLTQYFYFGGLPEPEPPGDLSNAEQAARAEAAMARGELGSLLFVTDPDGARIELIADPLGEMYGEHVL